MVTQENVDKFKAALITACDKHIANGGKIISGAFVINIGNSGVAQGMCPIGCLSDGINYLSSARAILESEGQEIWNFIDAFDGKRASDPNGPLALLGAELRAKYITNKGQ